MMRIRKLELVRFGMFSDKTFDFGPRPEDRSDFHVIYGPNEAGKTTAAEGFLRLLYGFRSRQEPFDYLHQRGNLMIRGAVEIDGALRTVVRLPGNPPLTDERGGALPQSLLSNALSGLEDTEYRKLFCLNDKTIEEGGDEITSGQGDIGRLLFGAAAGISDVSEILDGVRKQAEELFKPRGSRQILPRLKRELKDIEDQIRDKDTTAAQYQSLRNAFENARAAEAAARDKRKTLLAQRTRLQSYDYSLPRLDQIRELKAGLAELEHYPDQAVVSPADLDELWKDRIGLCAAKDQHQQDIKEFESQRLAVELNPEHLKLNQELKRIEGVRSRFMTALPDLPKREQELAVHIGDMRRAAEDLGLSGEIELKALVLSRTQLRELQRLCRRKEQRAQETETERQEITRLSGQIAQAEAEIAKLEGNPPEGGQVLEILDGINTAKWVSDHQAAAEKTVNAAEAAGQARAALSVRGMTFETVPAVSMTSLEAGGLAAQLGAETSSAEHQRSRLRETEQKGERLNRAISQLKGTAGLLTDTEVQQLRATREERWAEHKSDLTSESADVFETAMRRLDQASDRRMEQAADLGKLRQLESDAREIECQRAGQGEELSRLLAKAESTKQRLADVSKAVGIDPPLAPEALAEWLQNVEAALAAQDGKSRAEKKFRPLIAGADDLRRSLAAAMGLTDRPMDFAEIMSRAEDAAEAHRDHRNALKAARDRLEDYRREQQRRDDNLKELESHLTAVSGDLDALIKDLFDFEVGTSDLGVFQEALQELRGLDRSRSEAEHRIESMRDDVESFRAAVSDLARRFNQPDVEDPTRAYDALKRLSDAADQASDKRRDLSERQDKASASLSSTQRQLDQLDARVRGFASGFPPGLGINSLDDLRAAAAKTERAVKLREGLRRLERELRTTLGVSSMDEAESLLAGHTLADVKSRLAEAGADADQAEKELEGAIAEHSRAQAALDGISADDEIAALVETRRTLELNIEETALDYLELHFGCRLAEEAIRRYSERHRSGMLKTTERAFSELTDGAYQKLQTQHEGKTEILMAIDRSGSAKRAEALSKGTRFQLYLALRAAAYEQRASSGAILPFFCDDVFETFDEDRTRAACRLMQRIGRTGQAIYLTHHRHVAEIAQEVCGGEMQLHEL